MTKTTQWSGKTIRVGDEVEVYIRGNVTEIGHSVLSINNFHYVSQSTIGIQSIRVVPKPLKVGDAVKSKAGSLLGGIGQQAYSRYLVKGEVLAIDEGSQQAWVRPILYSDAAGNAAGNASGRNATYNLAELERCDG